jgi:hypothetical protein
MEAQPGWPSVTEMLSRRPGKIFVVNNCPKDMFVLQVGMILYFHDIDPLYSLKNSACPLTLFKAR